MAVKGLTNAGAAPALEAVMRFAAARQKLLAHNIANIDTPDYRVRDVPVQEFREQLSAAIERRRRGKGNAGGAAGDLEFRRGGSIVPGPGGTFALKPKEVSSGVLRHDRGNADVERLMQDLVENATAFRTAAELLRAHTDRLQRAISERAG